ncbi:MAG: RNA-binding S4 domain-containing protein [Wenzhouxiangella sp.]|nr:MAG: RNA-binding S4 domain-containing protein [Wenzhouxiangella sp.]
MSEQPVRLDKWLWAARFFKTRGLAQQAVKGGRVEINGARPKASRLVRSGDSLRIGKGEMMFEVEVLSVGEKRVSAPLAREMYRETEASLKRRQDQIEARRQEGEVSGDPGRRPDRRQRRAIRKVLRGD